MKNIRLFYLKIFIFLVVKFSVYEYACFRNDVYMDLLFVFFSSPALFENPRADRIYCLCSVRRSRKGMPQAVKSIRQIGVAV